MKILMRLLLTLSMISCSKDDGVPCDRMHQLRIGANCMDGTRTKVTDSSACSHHNGVQYWVCK